MSDLLGIGLSGVSAYRSAIAAVADNVSNAETPGYARRSVRLREAASTGSGAIGQGEGVAFSGVSAASVTRSWDDFKAADARLSASVAGRALARKQWLTSVETALGESSGNVGQLVGAFYEAGVVLSAAPDDRLARGAMLAALDEAVAGIRKAHSEMARVADGITTAAQIEVEEVNAGLAHLADVNKALRQSEPDTSSHASLEDERDRLLDALAGKLDFSTAIADDGTVSLTLAGNTGVTLLDRSTRALLVLAPAADGRLTLELRANGAASPLAPADGSLAGLLQAASSTADQRAELESMATDFMNDVNSWSRQGVDRNGNPGANLLGAAGGAATLALLTSDPDAIAAAAPGGAPNGNLLDLASLRGNDGYEARWAALVAGHSQMLAAARSEASAASTRRDNSFAARDETAGIDLDREAADLMRFQQAYGASAKIIQTARETLQSILDLF